MIHAHPAQGPASRKHSPYESANRGSAYHRGAFRLFKAAGRWIRRRFSPAAAAVMVDGDSMDDPDQRIWQVVAQIPCGCVATYGQVAALAGLPRGARRVGRAMAQLPAGSALPWHRVINAAGRSAIAGAGGVQQRRLLRAEGVVFLNGKVDLGRWQWCP